MQTPNQPFTNAHRLLQRWAISIVVFCLLAGNLAAVEQSSPTRKLAKRREATNEKNHPLQPPLKLARSSSRALEEIEDYEATFIKKEVVNGTMYPHAMHIKHRLAPFSVYLLFLKAHQGREVIYFDKKNESNMLVHETGILGLVGTLTISPTSAQALSEGLNPITQIGMPKMIERLIGRWERELNYGEVDVTFYPNARLGKMHCKVVQISHPVPRKHFKYHMTRLFTDKETNFPVRIEEYAFPRNEESKPPLMAEYTYRDIRINIGLKDIDFDTKNPKYNY